MRATRGLVLIGIAFALAVQPSLATITFEQLSDDMFVVSHRIKVIGSRSKAQKMVYEKAASVCVAAGFKYMEIRNQESEAAQRDDTANASVRVRFYFVDGEERIDCQKNASAKYIEQATVKLEKKGYVPPDPASIIAKKEIDTGSCSIEQITSMVEAGLTSEQIKAACGG